MPRLGNWLKGCFSHSEDQDCNTRKGAFPSEKKASAAAYHHQPHRQLRAAPKACYPKAKPVTDYPTYSKTTPFHKESSQLLEKQDHDASRRESEVSFASGETYCTNDATTVSSLGASTLVPNYAKGRTETSPWRGKPIGKPYDRREELTEEDEDMWARMAM